MSQGIERPEGKRRDGGMGLSLEQSEHTILHLATVFGLDEHVCGSLK